MNEIVESIKGEVSLDDRGTVRFVNNFSPEKYKRFYIVTNHQRNFIRGWHGHRTAEKAVMVVKGTAIIAVSKMSSKNGKFPLPAVLAEPITTFTLSELVPSILVIPPGYFNASKTLEDKTKILYFSTDTIQAATQDDERIPWDTIYGNWKWYENSFR